MPFNLSAILLPLMITSAANAPKETPPAERYCGLTTDMTIDEAHRYLESLGIVPSDATEENILFEPPEALPGVDACHAVWNETKLRRVRMRFDVPSAYSDTDGRPLEWQVVLESWRERYHSVREMFAARYGDPVDETPEDASVDARCSWRVGVVTITHELSSIYVEWPLSASYEFAATGGT